MVFFGTFGRLSSSLSVCPLLQLWPVCRFGIHVCNMGIPLFSPLLCQASLYFCQVTQFSSVLALAMPEHGSVNVYDVRKQVSPPPPSPKLVLQG